jgi:hypothetical protein
MRIDTLGKLRAHGYTLEGYCNPCMRLYRKAPPDEPQPPSFFKLSLDELIAEHGADQAIATMPDVACPYCGSRETGAIVQAPQKPLAR